MAIKIDMLRCFRAVADAGSLADAAAKLGRTPSAVSMMLRQFEDHIGAPLFETGRKSRLTPLGHLIRQEATRELAHFERTVSAIEGLARAEKGHVRIIATPSVAQVVLPPILRDFMAQHPEIRIDLRDADSAAIEEELRAERAEIGLASLGSLPGYTRQNVLSDRFGLVCRADHALARTPRLDWEDLAELRFIANGLCAQIADPAFLPVLQAATLTVHNTGSLLSLVQSGVGVTILPRLTVNPEKSGLAFLPLPGAEIRRDVFLFAPEPHLQTPATRAMSHAILSAKIKQS
jgi:DNA-binding transcriptional LysR family regulator